MESVYQPSREKSLKREAKLEPEKKEQFLDELELLEEKFWNELFQVMTSDDNFKIRKSEIDSLLLTETIQFFQHLSFYERQVTEKFKKLNSKKNG